MDASNRNTLEQSYKNIALKIGTVTDPNCSLEAALRELENYKSNWLLLFDGADDLEDISGLWPPGIHGDILYTSRNPMLRRLLGSQMRCVSEMNENEASELLLKSARLDVSVKSFKKQASDIVTDLGCLALAVDQAGAYIASGECYIDDFLSTFNAHRQHLLQNEAYKGASGYDQAVYATWDLSYAAIARQAGSAANEALHQGSKAALQILQILPFFHNENIMEEIFKAAAENPGAESDVAYEVADQCSSALFRLRSDGTWETQNFRLGIRTLISFSLVGRDDFRCHLFMHRLVNSWSLDRLTAVEKNRFCNEARDILARSIAWRFATSDYDFRRNLLPHITALHRQMTLSSSSTKSHELTSFALVFSEAGRWDEAEKLQVQVMKTSLRVLKEEHPSTLNSMANLASTYRNQGRWDEAEKLQVQVMKTSLRVLKEEHPDTLNSMINLASTYWNQGRWNEAEKLNVQVMKTSLRVLKEEHPFTLSSIANLASTYWDQGRWNEAEKLQLQVMKTSLRVLKEEHPSTLTSMANLAVTYLDQGRWDEAEKLQMQVMKTRKRVLKEEHPSTLSSMANLAVTYLNQGRWDEAEKLQMQVMKTRKRVLKEEHPDTLSSMANLVATYRNQGRWDEAEKLGVQVMKTRKRVLKEEHPATLTSMAHLASTYRKQGRWDDAIELIQVVVNLRTKVIGVNHPDTLHAVDLLNEWSST